MNYKIPNKLTSLEELICEIVLLRLQANQKNNVFRPTENTWRIWCGNIQRRNPENPCHKMLRKRDACHIWHTSRFSVTSMSISRRFRSSFHTISSKYSRPTLITHVFRPFYLLRIQLHKLRNHIHTLIHTFNSNMFIRSVISVSACSKVRARQSLEA